MKKSVWVLEDFADPKKNYGMFSTKLKAIEAIDLWKVGADRSYTVLNEGGLQAIKPFDGESIIIWLTVTVKEEEHKAAIYLREYSIDNGCDLIYL